MAWKSALVFRFVWALLMEDGALAHRAVSRRKWLQDRKVKPFQGWPKNSPNLNPIENLWSQVKHAQWLEHATSIPGLKKITHRVWRQVTPEYIHTLYESMPKRMTAVIQAGGTHTKY